MKQQLHTGKFRYDAQLSLNLLIHRPELHNRQPLPPSLQVGHLDQSLNQYQDSVHENRVVLELKLNGQWIQAHQYEADLLAPALHHERKIQYRKHPLKYGLSDHNIRRHPV